MYNLSEEQINFIENDLQRRGISMTELRENLLDHICCIIENEMTEANDFKEFYVTQLRKFYKKELQEIQNETKILLTHKNYYSMKKTMMISGLVSSLGFIFGGILKFFHLPGAAIFLILGFASFALFFLPLAIWLKTTEKPSAIGTMKLYLALAVGIAAVLGTLFKIMHWPGATFLMNGSFIAFVFIFIPFYFITGVRDSETKQKVTVNTVLFIGAAGILFSLVNLSGSRKFNQTFVQTDNLILDNLNLIQKSNSIRGKDSVQKVDSFSCLDAALEMTDFVIEKIRLAAGDSGKPASLDEISMSGDFEFSNHVLFYLPTQGKDAYAYKLRNAYEKVDNLIKDENLKIVNDNLTNIDGEKIKWEDNFLKNNTTSVTVRKLNLLKLKLQLLKNLGI